MRKLGDTDVFDKTVALRVDLNVPVKDGKALPSFTGTFKSTLRATVLSKTSVSPNFLI